MTGDIAGPAGPDVRLLADLDAGLLDEATAREVRAAADADPAARAVLDALAATRAELAALPDPPVPPALAARWSAALAAEQSPACPPRAPQPSPSAPPPATPAQRPHRRMPPRPPARQSTAPRRPADPPDRRTRRTAPEHRRLAREHRDHAGPYPRPPAAARHIDSWPAAHHAGSATPLSPHRAGSDTCSRPTAGGRRGSASRPPRNPVRRPGRWLRRPAVLAAALLVAVGVVAALRARPEPLPAVGRPQLVAEALSARRRARHRGPRRAHPPRGLPAGGRRARREPGRPRCSAAAG